MPYTPERYGLVDGEGDKDASKKMSAMPLESAESLASVRSTSSSDSEACTMAVSTWPWQSSGAQLQPRMTPRSSLRAAVRTTEPSGERIQAEYIVSTRALSAARWPDITNWLPQSPRDPLPLRMSSPWRLSDTCATRPSREWSSRRCEKPLECCTPEAVSHTTCAWP